MDHHGSFLIHPEKNTVILPSDIVTRIHVCNMTCIVLHDQIFESESVSQIKLLVFGHLLL